MRENYILIINAGSSSFKFKLFDEKLTTIANGMAERVGLNDSFILYNFQKKENKIFIKLQNHDEAIKALLKILHENKIDFAAIRKIGHRVVHGGEQFIKPVLISLAVLKELKKFNKLAPLHNPHNIAGIKAGLKLFPNSKHYAIFDTAFHSSMPDYAFLYPLPTDIYNKYRVRRYGFHGLSYQYVSREAAKHLKIKKPNLIICHLGSGCSICAVKKGKSIDTSMGFTPLEGVMMLTRSGDIDPTIIFYLEQKGWTMKKINDLLNYQSGLVGVSSLKDMRDIMIANHYQINNYKSLAVFTAQQRKLAQLALRMFIYRIKKYIGAYAAILGQVDAIVFTAGIGERNADVRKLIMKELPIKTKVLIVPTDEEKMMVDLIK